MKSVAYLSNSFPEPVEPYVGEEIAELRPRGCNVVACSFRRPRQVSQSLAGLLNKTFYVFPLRFHEAASASWLCIWKVGFIADLLWRGIHGSEPVARRLRNLFHTWLGAYLATILRGKDIGHIHIHHGYFSAWAGMIAARFLGASFSMTLHGSDLLLRGDYLDCKLANCSFCVTVSEFNRRFIREHHAAAEQHKILIHRLGVDLDFWHPLAQSPTQQPFTILCVGRLHRVKNHEFLLQACHTLKNRGVEFRCAIAGSGEERGCLQQLLHELNLEKHVALLGHIPREQLPRLYSDADVVVLTSHSEGIPVTLMEAMAMERIARARHDRHSGVSSFGRDRFSLPAGIGGRPCGETDVDPGRRFVVGSHPTRCTEPHKAVLQCRAKSCDVRHRFPGTRGRDGIHGVIPSKKS